MTTSESIERLRELADRVDSARVKDVRLYLITRRDREGVSRKLRARDRYEFEGYQADVTSELQQVLKKAVSTQIHKVVQNDDLDLADYDYLADHEGVLCRYTTENSTYPFVALVREQLLTGNDLRKVKGLTDLVDRLFAYSICIRLDDDEVVYTFRKVVRANIAVDHDENPEVPYVRRAIRAVFNTDSLRLDVLHGETLTLDGKVDCFFFDEHFYVLAKGAFENIIGITDELEEIVGELLDQFDNTGLVEGLSEVRNAIGKGILLLKRLAGVAKVDEFRRLDNSRLAAMRKIISEFKLTIGFRNGKLVIEDASQIDTFVKLLMDAYVQSHQTGNKYCAPKKSRILPPS